MKKEQYSNPASPVHPKRRKTIRMELSLDMAFVLLVLVWLGGCDVISRLVTDIRDAEVWYEADRLTVRLLSALGRLLIVWQFTKAVINGWKK